MENHWVKFGCFLTGYKYRILQGCSEVAHRAVKRYTAALIIICTLWGFIGYTFVGKYLKGEWHMSLFGGALFVLIILQVERQIILSDPGGKAKYWVRGSIAFIMAIIGSIIIDQYIFREDIAHKELFELNAQVDSLMPSKQAELKRQINEADSGLAKKERERTTLITELTRNPFIKVVTRQDVPVPISTVVVDSNKRSITRTNQVLKTANIVNSIPNPKSSMVNSIDQQIKDMGAIKALLEERLIRLRSDVEREAKTNRGFLQELQVMQKILNESGPALVIWLLWFFLLLGLEVFILVNKIANAETDYDVTIQHHMELQKRKLHLLAMYHPGS